MRRIGLAFALAGVSGLALVGATIASPSSARSKKADVVDIVGYSTPKAAYTQLAEAFKKTPAGKDVDFTLSFGASGDQSRAVVAGQKADIVAFALAADVFPLVKAGLVANNWNKN